MNLDDDSPEVREKGTTGLFELVMQNPDIFRHLLEKQLQNSSPEAKSRIEKILDETKYYVAGPKVDGLKGKLTSDKKQYYCDDIMNLSFEITNTTQKNVQVKETCITKFMLCVNNTIRQDRCSVGIIQITQLDGEPIDPIKGESNSDCCCNCGTRYSFTLAPEASFTKKLKLVLGKNAVISEEDKKLEVENSKLRQEMCSSMKLREIERLEKDEKKRLKEKVTKMERISSILYEDPRLNLKPGKYRITVAYVQDGEAYCKYINKKVSDDMASNVKWNLKKGIADWKKEGGC